MRINKYLAKSGICSRRKAEELVLSGNIKINDKVINDLSTIVNEKDIVKYNDKIVLLEESFEYILLNKPVGYVSTVSDPYADKTVLALINTSNRLFPVGRLDKDSRGLIILTNDGDLTYKLTHPSGTTKKTYLVKIIGNPKEKDLNSLRKGIVLEGYRLKPTEITKKSKDTYEIIISEGRNRQIRKMFEHIGCKVIDLYRVKIGNINIGNLKEGKYRNLSSKEVSYLKGK
ncbi:pseudouridine synthase [Miniphocaeibacter massiliensis]|uniref:pseudouridine synthase n=1 Tax=Miniphocaeibacter massiliensis TaxID=2041841 RepID=UPI000C08B65D|nr:pseudouridine synthase [Miniphocaeibacter massiliensis]